MKSVFDLLPSFGNGARDHGVLELTEVAYDPPPRQPVLELVPDMIPEPAPEPASGTEPPAESDEQREETPPLELVTPEDSEDSDAPAPTKDAAASSEGPAAEDTQSDRAAEEEKDGAAPEPGDAPGDENPGVMELTEPLDPAPDDGAGDDPNEPLLLTDVVSDGPDAQNIWIPAGPGRQEGYPHRSTGGVPPGGAIVSRRMVNIDLEALAASGMVTPGTDWSQVAEEFRFIKRPLLLKAFDQHAPGDRPRNLIMVTSSRPGEGKTFCAVNLAMSIAQERDLTVLLVDGDIAKPSIPEVLGFQPDIGLVDLLSDNRLSMSDVLLRTNIPNLAVLPAGHPHQLATELLASERMDRFVTELATRYPDRVVIFDSPPALLSSIPSVLSLYAGQLVFVVQADKSTQAMVDAALGVVSACENIYLLLNQARVSSGAERFEGYYGRYGYGYGRGGGR